MNARTFVGVIIAIVFLGLSVVNLGNLPAILGSTVGLLLYLRLSQPRSSVPPAGKLWLAAACGGLFANLVVVSAAESVDLAFAIGYAFANAVLMGLLAAAAAQFILTGQAQLRRCPFCAARIRSDAKVCRYCHRDIPVPVTTAKVMQ